MVDPCQALQEAEVDESLCVGLRDYGAMSERETTIWLVIDRFIPVQGLRTGGQE